MPKESNPHSRSTTDLGQRIKPTYGFRRPHRERGANQSAWSEVPL